MQFSGWREYLKVYTPIAVLVAVGFAAAYQLIDPAPPSTLRIAAGAPDGAYTAAAERYQTLLAREGVRLEIVHTTGSIENLRLLKADPSADIGFIQSGTGVPEASPEIVGLASVFYEPLWVFVRADRSPRRLAELAGRRIAVGVEGSGTRALALELLHSAGVFERSTTVLDIGGKEAVDAMLAGAVDAAFFVTARPVPALSRLLEAPRIRLLNFEHAEAYKLLHPYLTSVTLPAGAIRLDAGIPAEDITLLAPAATLAAREDVHPALIDLVMRAAKEVHQPRQLFAKRGEFPSAAFVDFPLDPQAKRNLESGPSFLRRGLPFWAANLVERMWVLILPLITIAIPLLRIAPPTYRWQVQRKIYRWYKFLRAIEEEFWLAQDAKARVGLIDRLDQIARDVGKITVPLAYAEQLYHLRLHIEFLRQRIRTSLSSPPMLPAKPTP